MSVRTAVRLRVNGDSYEVFVEPRKTLADTIREDCGLTGTHLGCEHGVCGACTVYLDDAPARSCITYAIACEGADVRTIEGFDEDVVMAELREAFAAEHALQCGYCTPGMLVTARDIVLRLPDADETRIRKELAGNLCRCTGYVGIVRAIQRVLAQRGNGREASVVTPHAQRALAPAMEETFGIRRNETAASVAPRSSEDGRGRGGDTAQQGGQKVGRGDAKLHQSFTVDHPREKVWAFFGRLDEVTACLPGAAVTGRTTDDRVDTILRVKLGPIVAEFNGTAEVTRDPSTHTGVIRGSARDARSSSTTRGEIHYALSDERGGAATRVDVDVDYTLTGTLAQFGRSGLAQDIARRMTAAFAQNLEARLGAGPGTSAAEPQRGRPAELNAGSLLLTAVWGRLKAVWRSLLGR